MHWAAVRKFNSIFLARGIVVNGEPVYSKGREVSLVCVSECDLLYHYVGAYSVGNIELDCDLLYHYVGAYSVGNIELDCDLLYHYVGAYSVGNIELDCDLLYH